MEATYIVSYDLDNPGQNYKDLITAIKTHAYAKITESCWCIFTDSSSTDIRNDLKQYIDANDKLFVAKLSGESAWSGLPDKVSEWILNR